jgi:hypothetical protein
MTPPGPRTSCSWARCSRPLAWRSASPGTCSGEALYATPAGPRRAKMLRSRGGHRCDRRSPPLSCSALRASGRSPRSGTTAIPPFTATSLSSPPKATCGGWAGREGSRRASPATPATNPPPRSLPTGRHSRSPPPTRVRKRSTPCLSPEVPRCAARSTEAGPRWWGLLPTAPSSIRRGASPLCRTRSSCASTFAPACGPWFPSPRPRTARTRQTGEPSSSRGCRFRAVTRVATGGAPPRTSGSSSREPQRQCP